MLPRLDRFCYAKPGQIEWVQKSPAMLAKEKQQAVHLRAADRREMKRHRRQVER